MTIEQTQSRAILNWDSFNVGRNTTLQFKQNASDAALNRVVGASAKPSEIHGAIKADGTVLVVNQNGVIFTGTSQVNARNLVAAAATITDQQFRDKGIYTDANGTLPTFKDALGQIQVQAGARIDTAASTTATKGGGYVLLLGREVHNAGAIATPGGQTALAAGDDFYIRKGYGTDGNLKSTTAGNEVSATLKPASTAGLVRNSGLISATTGDITLTGHQIRQDGVLVASTDIGARRHPPAEPRQRRQRQRDAGRGQRHRRAAGAVRRDRPGGPAHRRAQDAGRHRQQQHGRRLRQPEHGGRPPGPAAHRSGERQPGLVPGRLDHAGHRRQIAVSARKQTLLDAGARLDVAGAIGVRLAMESNNLKIDVQGNEQRDAPVNRDSKLLNNSEIWIDRRTLVKVPGGANGYAGERWYTGGGLLEVGGYLATSGRTASEWLAQGGTATFTGGALVTRAGSDINLSGGTLDVQDGYIRQSWLRGADGRLYDVSRAPGDLLYTGLYKGFEQVHQRWGDKATRVFYNPLIGPGRGSRTATPSAATPAP